MYSVSVKNPKARKQHRCDLCCGIIEKGEVYESQFNKDGGDVWTWKGHLKCQKLCVDLKLFEDDGVTTDLFIEVVHEKYKEFGGNDPEDEVDFEDKLTFVIDKVRDGVGSKVDNKVNLW